MHFRNVPCGVLISAKLIYGISMHVIYCSCVNGSNLDQSLAVADTGIRQWGGRLYWRGGIFQRCRNLFKIGGGADFVKLLTGGGGGGGGCSPLRRGGGAVNFWHTENTFC